ncbi:MAG TPA: glycosyltransferase family 4 protein [Methylomirabilota bacterium]|nr:glycosyltransferase family 4 protein [Methylomirabilota bacterium]
MRELPLRIAFLTHEPFFPPSGGGSAEAVYLVEEMARRGHEVHVFCPQISDAESVERKFGIRLHQFTKWKMGRYARFRNFKYLAYPFFLGRMAAAAARATKFNLLFSQHAISAVAAGKLKRKLNIPVVMNFPDLLTGFMETWPRYVAPRPLVNALMRYEISLPSRYDVDAVLTVSDALADYFSATGFPPGKIRPIYYGYDAKNFPFRERPPAKAKPPVVVMHGSFDAHHLSNIAFGAIQFVTQHRPGTIFRFIGKQTDSLEKFLRRAQRQIPDFKFEATGFVPYAEVSKHLADANVGIVPYEESAGTHCAFVAKVVEYVASGLPAVSTPLKSVQSYFKNDTMVRFSKFNGEDFGKKIINWLDEPTTNWQLDAAKSAARVQAELDWQPLCRKAIDFVEKTVSTAKPPS